MYNLLINWRNKMSEVSKELIARRIYLESQFLALCPYPLRGSMVGNNGTVSVQFKSTMSRCTNWINITPEQLSAIEKILMEETK